MQGLERYAKAHKVGEGTYGNVFLATDKLTGRTVALKKIKAGDVKEGVNFTALREIKLLQELRHPNVVELLDVFSRNGSVYLVFEFLETDLDAVIRDSSLILYEADIKAYMLMLMRGVLACHDSWILHRDLKPDNLLIAPDGQLKIADFGLARMFGSPDRNLSNQVVTRWYRAPELFFGAKKYGAAVDMWAVGCIFAELMLRVPYFPGESDIDQLAKIFAALGTPTDADWPGMRELPGYVEFEEFRGTPFRILFKAASDQALDLLGRLLTYNPAKRITAAEALQHPYFAGLDN
eukprot:tig00000863_g4965.t1